MKKNVFIFLLLILTLGCSKQPEPSPITIKQNENFYENSYFGFTVEKPDGWFSREAKESLFLQRKNSMASAKTDLKTIVADAMKKTLPLFSFFEFRHGSQLKVNPSVLSVAQNMENFPEAKNACDYLNFVMAVLEKGEIKYIFDKNCQSTRINGKEFTWVKAYSKVGEDLVYQTYYATIMGDHAISLILTYFDEETKKSVESVINSLKFKG